MGVATLVANFDVDFVVSWVDDTDPSWQEKYNRFAEKDLLDEKGARYRDFEIFKYWFRAVQQYAPWVRKIYLVTDGQVPNWLNTNHEKIQVVDHTEIIDKKYLPVFNSNAIDLNLHKIPGLSEHFVYFNDDMFINRPVSKKDFFSDSGLPKDSAGLNAIQPAVDFDYIHVNNMMIINHRFNKRDVMKKQFFKFINPINLELNIYTALLFFWPKFTRFFDTHYPYSLLKSSMSRVLIDNETAYVATMNDRFRGVNDISIWLIRYYSLATGMFSLRSPRFGKIYDLYSATDRAVTDIVQSKHKTIVVNDNSKFSNEEFLDVKYKLIGAFEKKLKDKSEFEI